MLPAHSPVTQPSDVLQSIVNLLRVEHADRDGVDQFIREHVFQ